MGHSTNSTCSNCERGGHPDFCMVVDFKPEPGDRLELKIRIAHALSYMEGIRDRMTGTDHDWISTYWVFEVAEKCIGILKGES